MTFDISPVGQLRQGVDQRQLPQPADFLLQRLPGAVVGKQFQAADNFTPGVFQRRRPHLHRNPMAGLVVQKDFSLAGFSVFHGRGQGAVRPAEIVPLGVDVNQNVADAKKQVRKAYKLNPILTIQFIHKGKVLPDNVRFASLGIFPKKDVITVMATQAGGL